MTARADSGTPRTPAKERRDVRYRQACFTWPIASPFHAARRHAFPSSLSFSLRVYLLFLSLSTPSFYRARSPTRGFSSGLASGLEGSPIAAPISRGTIRMPLNGDPRKSCAALYRFPAAYTDYERNAQRTRFRHSTDHSASIPVSIFRV